MGWSTWLLHGPPQPSEDSSEPKACPASVHAELACEQGWCVLLHLQVTEQACLGATTSVHAVRLMPAHTGQCTVFPSEEGKDTEETPAGDVLLHRKSAM